MSQLSQQLKDIPPASARVRKGPKSKCQDVYPADIEDWNSIELLRQDKGMYWREVQDYVDGLLGVTQFIENDKFRYHWKRKCQCWPVELRLS